MPPIIEVENLGKRYRLGKIGAGSLRNEIENAVMRLRGELVKEDERDFWALRDISFTVNEGEVLGIIGRNGAGKSTLLKLLSRITEPTEGRAILRGRVASLLEVGTGFHPELSGRENIYLNGAIMGMNRAEVARKFDEIVEFSGTEKFIDTPVKRYSSGMRVRLGFAVAAHLEPEILIIDEVLAVGDAEFQKRCLGKMGEVARAGRTILFVSHQMPMVQRLCHRALLLKEGGVEQEGEVDEIVELYFREQGVKQGPPVQQLSAYPRTKPEYRGLTVAVLEGTNSPSTSKVAMGGEFRLRVEFDSPREMQNAKVGMIVENAAGLRLFSLTSKILDTDNRRLAGRRGRVWFSIDDFPLLHGEYWVTLSLSDAQMGKLDVCDRCLSFTVYPQDVYGSGAQFSGRNGLFFVRARFDFEMDK